MKKLSFLEKMDIPESEFRKDEKLEKEVLELEKNFKEKTKREFDELDELIWQSHERFRRGQVINAPNLSDLHTEYTNLSRKKDVIKDAHRSATEEKHRQRDILVRPYSEEAMTTLDLEYRKIMPRYICELPDLAQTPGGSELPFRGHRRNLETDIRYMTIRTNADAIVRGQQLLVSFKGRIVNAPSLKALKESLEVLQKEYDLIDWNAREVEVEESEFERLDITKPNQLGYLIGDKVIRVKGVNP